MAQRIPTVQLLYYCYLYGQATGKPVLDAAFVALGEDGGERPLFGKGMTIEERERALSLIPRLIGSSSCIWSFARNFAHGKGHIAAGVPGGTCVSYLPNNRFGY